MANTTRKNIARAIIAAGAAAAAGYYFYGSKNAKQNRAQAAQWAEEMKKEAMKQLEKMPSIDRDAVVKAVDTAAGAVIAARMIDKKEIVRAATELKTYWQNLIADVRGENKSKRPPRTTTQKRATKKRARKSPSSR